jgi:GTPase KRas protein
LTFKKFLQRHFTGIWDPTIEDGYRKQCVIDDKPCLLDILDVVSLDLDEYDALREQWYRDRGIFFLTYSINSRGSPARLKRAVEQILRVKHKESAASIPMILVGNKSDRGSEREVSRDEGAALAEEFGCPFIETSAKDNTNIDEAFYTLIREVWRHEKRPKLI